MGFRGPGSLLSLSAEMSSTTVSCRGPGLLLLLSDKIPPTKGGTAPARSCR
jgi:hypothetical protein